MSMFNVFYHSHHHNLSMDISIFFFVSKVSNVESNALLLVLFSDDDNDDDKNKAYTLI